MILCTRCTRTNTRPGIVKHQEEYMCARCLQTNNLHVFGLTPQSDETTYVPIPTDVRISDPNSLLLIVYRIMAVPKVPRATQLMYLHIQRFMRTTLSHANLSSKHLVLQQPVTLAELASQITIGDSVLKLETRRLEALQRAAKSVGISEQPKIMYVAKLYDAEEDREEQQFVDPHPVASDLDSFLQDPLSARIIMYATERWDMDIRDPAALPVGVLARWLQPSEYPLQAVILTDTQHRQSYRALTIALNSRPGGMQLEKKPNSEELRALQRISEKEHEEKLNPKLSVYWLQLLTINKLAKTVTVTTVSAQELQGEIIVPTIPHTKNQSLLSTFLRRAYTDPAYTRRRNTVWDYITEQPDTSLTPELMRYFMQKLPGLVEEYGPNSEEENLDKISKIGTYISREGMDPVPNPKWLDFYIGRWPASADKINTLARDLRVWGLFKQPTDPKAERVLHEPQWSLEDASFTTLLAPGTRYGKAGIAGGTHLGDLLYFGLDPLKTL